MSVILSLGFCLSYNRKQNMYSQDEVALVFCAKVYGETGIEVYFRYTKLNNDIFDDIQSH